MWQTPRGGAHLLKSPCVLAHPALSLRSNHRQSSLRRVAVCAAGSAVLIEVPGGDQRELMAATSARYSLV